MAVLAERRWSFFIGFEKNSNSSRIFLSTCTLSSELDFVSRFSKFIAFYAIFSIFCLKYAGVMHNFKGKIMVIYYLCSPVF